METNKTKYLFFLTLLFFLGCIEDPEIPKVSFELNTTAEILSYLEEQGDYINTDLAPSLIEASEVNANLNNYLLIDVRPAEQFTNGHIQGAINIRNTELYNYFLNNDVSSYPKVVIISQTGQAAAYYASLLILSGYNNVFSLNFGITSWNMDFAEIWLHYIGNSEFVGTFNNKDYYGFNNNPLPAPSFSESANTIEKKLKERIEILLKEGFKDNPQDIQSNPDFTLLFDDIDELKDNELPENYYFVCYCNPDAYYTSTGIAGDPLAGFGHPAGTVLFSPGNDLKTTEKLQTLPLDKTIVIYSYTGQSSAYVAAYLKVLGYNVKSLFFGTNNLIYSRMVWFSTLKRHAFTPSNIMNFPYVVGP